MGLFRFLIRRTVLSLARRILQAGEQADVYPACTYGATRSRSESSTSSSPCGSWGGALSWRSRSGAVDCCVLINRWTRHGPEWPRLVAVELRRPDMVPAGLSIRSSEAVSSRPVDVTGIVYLFSGSSSAFAAFVATVVSFDGRWHSRLNADLRGLDAQWRRSPLGWLDECAIDITTRLRRRGRSPPASWLMVGCRA